MSKLLPAVVISAFFAIGAAYAASAAQYPITALGNCRDAQECYYFCEIPAHRTLCWSYNEHSAKTPAVLGDSDETDETLAAHAEERGIVFPIPELGECGSVRECKTYCDAPENHNACTAFAREYRIDRASKRADALARVAAELGCLNVAECREYCNDPENITQCRQLTSRSILSFLRASLPGPFPAPPDPASSVFSQEEIDRFPERIEQWRQLQRQREIRRTQIEEQRLKRDRLRVIELERQTQRSRQEELERQAALERIRAAEEEQRREQEIERRVQEEFEQRRQEELERQAALEQESLAPTNPDLSELSRQELVDLARTLVAEINSSPRPPAAIIERLRQVNEEIERRDLKDPDLTEQRRQAALAEEELIRRTERDPQTEQNTELTAGPDEVQVETDQSQQAEIDRILEQERQREDERRRQIRDEAVTGADGEISESNQTEPATANRQGTASTEPASGSFLTFLRQIVIESGPFQAFARFLRL